MIFVGIDWAEAHHDVCVLDRDGEVSKATVSPSGSVRSTELLK